MNCTAFRLVALALALPLSGWFVATAMSPAPIQDPKPAPEAKGEGQRQEPRGEGRRRGPGGGPSLHGAMEQMGAEYEKVTAGIADPTKNEATMQSLARMIQFAGASQNGELKNLATIPVEQQAAHKLEFRRMLTVLARDIAEVELLVIEGKNADAAKLFEAKVTAGADAGHAKFGGDEEHEEGAGGSPK